jgi:GT2 family glycosyltransferase
VSTTIKTLDISVLIPFKDRAKMTLECVRSLIEFGPELKEILLISNNSSEEELTLIKEGSSPFKNVLVMEYNQPFNYQKMNNWAVKQSSGELIFFFNNDTQLVQASKGTIERMAELATREDIGMVGCILLYGDKRTIQHAGVYLRPGSLGDHIYVGKYYKDAVNNAGSEEFPYDPRKDREVTAVTGAAQMVARKKFDTVKGFDDRFIICGGDVDLCIRLNNKGYQTWIIGKGYIVHKESQSRSFKPIPYQDFYQSYLSYMEGFDLKVGDPLSPKITEKMT